LLVAALLASGAYEPLFSSAYVTHHMAEALAGSCVADLPLVKGAHESSLWLRKVVTTQSWYQKVSGR
jgi:hypothetical protein